MKYDEAKDLMVDVVEGETPTRVAIHVAYELTLEDENGVDPEPTLAALKGNIPAGAKLTTWMTRPATFEEKLAAMSSGNIGGTPPMCNGHELERIAHYDEVPCWRIAYLAELKRKHADKDPGPGWVSGDFPNGWEHDETCFQCKGTGVQKEDDREPSWHCRGCGLRTDNLSDLYRSSCLAEVWGGDTYQIVAERRMEHEEDGHRYIQPGCPLCCVTLMQQKAERATAT